MTWRLFLIELRHWLKQPMVYIFFFLFALLGFGAVTWDDLVIGGQMANVKLNAPYMVFQWYSRLAFIGLFMVTAFVNATAIRDFTCNTAQIMFSTPLSKGQYLLSRFLGSTLVAMLPLLGITLGVYIGSTIPWPWVDPERLGPNDLMAHAQSFLYLTAPNILFSAAIIFSVSALVRSTAAAYITALVIIVASGFAGELMGEMDNQTLAALLDPFGGTGFDLVTRYWTVEDKNTALLPVSGVLLWNRLIWIAVSAVVFAFCYWRFSFTDRKARNVSRNVSEASAPTGSVVLPRVTKSEGAGARWRKFRRIVWNDFTGMLKGTAFMIVAGIGLVNMLFGLAFSTSLYENEILPVTYHVVDMMRGSFDLFTIILIVFYSGLLVWKEREARLDEVHDATPIPLGLSLASKYTALLMLLLVMLLGSTVAAMFFQLAKGYTHLEPGIYLGMYILPGLIGFGTMAALSFLVHVLVNNKYMGYGVFIVLIFLPGILLNAFDVNTNLASFGGAPGVMYSDMNGYGTALKGWIWFKAYWLAFALLLLLIAMFFWVRGKESGFKQRARLAIARMKANKRLAIPALMLWLGLGAWNYYNTQVLNEVPSGDAQEEDAAYYEKTYKKYADIPQPHYTDISFTIDLDPATRGLKSVAEVTVRNKSAVPIDSLHLVLGEGIEQEVEIPDATLALNDERVNYRIYKLNAPLAPGADLRFKVIATHEEKGFENSVTVMELNHNGTFFNNLDILPIIGYSHRYELQDKYERKKHDLGPKERMPRLTSDSAARMQQYLIQNSDWVNVRTVISTSSDQIAIAPGSLKRTWDENGRKYFEYVVDHKSMNFYSFMSARYEVLREKLGDIDVEVYYHAPHAENVPRIANSIKKSIAYYNAHFGPYRHKQARIIEFPRYEDFAQAFPGTMPYSEGIGFIADFSDTTDIDMTFYVVAHEMGHQWWAHQVMGADMQGSTLLSESMAQYSALMVMEDEFGQGTPRMRRFLKLESDRYLRQRGTEELKEMPLMKVENQQYMHYNKASVILYCLRDFVGEDGLNKAFRALVDTFGYAEPPYPTALDMYRELEKVVPDSLEYLLVDGFEKITVYNNIVEEAKARMLPDSTYEVTVTILGEKNYADSLGKEVKTPMNDWMDLSILRIPKFGKKADKSKNDVPLLHRRVRLKSGKNVFTFVVEEIPMRAELDRDHLFIDRVMDDNGKKVEVE